MAKTRNGSASTTLPDAMAGPDIERTRSSRRRGRAAKIGSYLLTVFLLVTLNFALPRATPGDPLTHIAAPTGSSQPGTAPSPDEITRAKLARYYNLDGSLLEQYGRYLSGLATGDLGTSVRYNAPVSDLIRERLGWTVLLVTASISLAVLFGVVAGIHSGWRRDRAADRGLLGLFVGFGQLPVYLVASLAIVVFAVKLRWLPLAGAHTPFAHYGPLGTVADIARHLVLPATVMALQFTILHYLVMRASMTAELGADYLVLGRAKGLSDRRLKYRYAARNAMAPIVTVVAVDIAAAVSLSVFVERVFSWPGVAKLMFEAISVRDYPLIQGCFLIISVLVIAVNLAADLLYPRIDPRVAR